MHAVDREDRRDYQETLMHANTYARTFASHVQGRDIGHACTFANWSAHTFATSLQSREQLAHERRKGFVTTSHSRIRSEISQPFFATYRTRPLNWQTHSDVDWPTLHTGLTSQEWSIPVTSTVLLRDSLLHPCTQDTVVRKIREVRWINILNILTPNSCDPPEWRDTACHHLHCSTKSLSVILGCFAVKGTTTDESFTVVRIQG